VNPRATALIASAIFLLSCARPKPSAHVPSPPRDHADSPFEAAEYFREQRVLGSALLPIERYLSAQRHARLMPRAQTAAPTFGTWEFLGPGNVGGRSRGIVIHPNDSKTIWIGGATGGIWKTTDGGQSWTPTSDFAPALSISSLAMSPGDPNTLYAGTGEQTQNWRGAGILKTTDGGTTWARLPATATPDFYFVNNVSISRANPARLYAATSTGIWSSADAGATWTRSLVSTDGGPAPTLTGGLTNGCYDVMVLPGRPADMVFAVCHPPGNGAQYTIFRNPDAAGTGTWSIVQSDPNMWYTALAFAPSQPTTVYAVSVTTDPGKFAKALLAVYRSTSSGDPGTWQARTSNQASQRLNGAILSVDAYYNFPGFCTSSAPNLNGQAGYNLGLAVDPLDPNRVWVSGIGIFRSDDGGANWGFASSGAHPDHHGFAFDPGFDGSANQVLYEISDGGIYKTTQARALTGTCTAAASGVTWSPLNHSYGTTQFYHGVPYPGGGAFMGGTQDNGTVRGNPGLGPNQWDFIWGGDGGVTRFDPLDASILYVENPHGGLLKSTDGGNSYAGAGAGLNETALNFPFVAYYVFDPANSLRLYTGGTQLWRTEDGMGHWIAESAPASQPADGTLDNIRAIAVSPADSNTVLFGMHLGRIFRSTAALSSDANTIWSSSQPRTGNVSFLEFDVRQPNVVYATYTTFNSAPGDQHIYRSTDGGATWTGIDGSGATGLPDIPVETLLVDPDDSTRLYAGTDLGVFASFDGGATWVRDDAPFADAITSSLAIDRNGGVKYLYAFTYGRGVWRVPIAGPGLTQNCTYSIAPSTYAAPATGGTLAVSVSARSDCAWAVAPAVTVSTAFASAQGPAFGTGNGAAYITVVPNHTTGSRSITLMVQDQPLSIAQSGATAALLGDTVASPYPVASVPFEDISNNVALTESSSDPAHSCTGSANFRTGWLRFTAPADGNLQVAVEAIRRDTGAGNSGIVVTVYPLNGTTLGAELACATVPKNAGAIQDAVATFAASKGSLYVAEISSISTGATSDQANLYIAIAPAVPAPTLDISPPEAIVPPGRTRRFQVVSSNLPNPAARWVITPQTGSIAADGTYTAPASRGNVTVAAQSFANAALQSTAAITVAPPAPVSLPAAAVANGASFQAGAVAPGEVVAIFGAGIGPTSLAGAQLNSQGRLSSNIAGTQVLFDNIPASLTYSSAGQVSAIVPYEVAGQSSTQMVVVFNGQSTPPLTLPVAAVSPALFTTDASGAGQAAAINQDLTRNGPQSPAPPGSIVALFGTGEGQTAPGGINGRIAGSVLPKPLANVSVTIGGVNADIAYAGAAPQSVAGLFQVNVKIPSGLKPGANAVVLTVVGVSSRGDVTISVGQ
jgi:uncharacterized protein (TIGR03437 family)